MAREYGSYDNNVLSYLEVLNTDFPAIDRTVFFACLSTALVMLSLYIIYKAFRLKSYRLSETTNEKRRSSWRLFLKMILFLAGIVIIYACTVNIKHSHVQCPHCCVGYSFDECRIFGKLIKINCFKTSYKPQDILNKRLGTGYYCRHSYILESRIRYWGGIKPSIEYHYGNITWGIIDTRELVEPYFITDQMKIELTRDENDRLYNKVEIEEDSH